MQKYKYTNQNVQIYMKKTKTKHAANYTLDVYLKFFLYLGLLQNFE